jgi:hypothetical protein
LFTVSLWKFGERSPLSRRPAEVNVSKVNPNLWVSVATAQFKGSAVDLLEIWLTVLSDSILSVLKQCYSILMFFSWHLYIYSVPQQEKKIIMEEKLCSIGKKKLPMELGFLGSCSNYY